MPPLVCVRPQCYKTKKVPNRCMAPNPWILWLRDNGGKGMTMQNMKDTYYPWRDDTYQGIPANNKVARQNKMCDVIDIGGPTAYVEHNAQQIQEAAEAAVEAAEVDRDAAATAFQRVVRGMLGRARAQRIMAARDVQIAAAEAAAIAAAEAAASAAIRRKMEGAEQIKESMLILMRKRFDMTMKKMKDAVLQEKLAAKTFVGLSTQLLTKSKIDALKKAAKKYSSEKKFKEVLKSFGKEKLKAKNIDAARSEAQKIIAKERLRETMRIVGKTALTEYRHGEAKSWNAAKTAKYIQEIAAQETFPCSVEEYHYNDLKTVIPIKQRKPQYDICTCIKRALNLPDAERITRVVGRGQGALCFQSKIADEVHVTRLNLISSPNVPRSHPTRQPAIYYAGGRQAQHWNTMPEHEFILGINSHRQMYNAVMNNTNPLMDLKIPKVIQCYMMQFEAPLDANGLVTGPPRRVGITIMENAGILTLSKVIEGKFNKRDFPAINVKNVLTMVGRYMRYFRELGIVHGDAHDGNWIVKRNDTSPTGVDISLIDFDRTCRFQPNSVPDGLKFYDIQLCLANIYNRKRMLGEAKCYDYLQCVYKGYVNYFSNSLTPLRHVESQPRVRSGWRVVVLEHKYFGPIRPEGVLPAGATQQQIMDHRFSIFQTAIHQIFAYLRSLAMQQAQAQARARGRA
jgi:hypothetical protein